MWNLDHDCEHLRSHDSASNSYISYLLMHGYLMTQTLILFSVLIIFLRQNPHEVYINPFNLRGKMIEFIQYRFLFSPIEFSQPMLTNCFHIFRLESVFKIAIFKVAAKTCCLKSHLEILNICIRNLDGHGFYGDIIFFLFAWSPPTRFHVYWF